MKEVPNLNLGLRRVKIGKKPRDQKDLKGKTHPLDPKPDEVLDITPNLEKYQNDPNFGRNRGPKAPGN
jgi:hypothetical protein